MSTDFKEVRGKALQKAEDIAFQAKRTASAMDLMMVLCLAYWKNSREASKGGTKARIEGQVTEKEQVRV